MGRNGNARRAPLLLGILLGLLAFAAGAVAAGRFLPEWRAGEALGAEVYRERYVEMVAKAGLRLEPGEPRVRLTTLGTQLTQPFRHLGDTGSEWLLATRTGVKVEVQHDARQGDAPPSMLTVHFSLDGQPQLVTLLRKDLASPFEVDDSLAKAEPFLPLMLAPGERLGPRRQDRFTAMPRLMIPLEGGTRPQHLLVLGGGALVIERQGGELTAASVSTADAYMSRMFNFFWIAVLVIVGSAALFLGLVLKRRVSGVNGALLALAAVLSLNPFDPSLRGSLPTLVFTALGFGVVTFFLWSSAESLLRSTDPDFTTSLDALRAGRIGPRGGRALLVGFAFGGVLAGLRLALYSLAEALPGSWLEEPSLPIPVCHFTGSPIAQGILLAGSVALALALAMRLLPIRWAPVAAALALGVLLHPVSLHPTALELAANTSIAGLLVWVCRRHGLTALLTASIIALLLPAVLFAGLHLDWMPVDFAVTSGLSLAVVALGFVGLSRPAATEIARLAPPAFVRRVEEQRRLRDEMRLLARMQSGLLPRSLPQPEGYELAARSLLANEAGGDLYDALWDDEGSLWIAAGDVAGHGYSCAIAQAMTKASLASLAGRGRTPAEVLGKMDRVLRTAGPTRDFTSLAILRLRPELGEVVWSNAGHPYPLLRANGEVAELALPGLPLGKGPKRVYEDRSFSIPPGGALVFCSDGLFEAVNAHGSVYGYERARELLRSGGDRSAEEILEILLADWRRHLRAAPPLDDTTILVVRRLGEAG